MQHHDTAMDAQAIGLLEVDEAQRYFAYTKCRAGADDAYAECGLMVSRLGRLYVEVRDAVQDVSWKVIAYGSFG